MFRRNIIYMIFHITINKKKLMVHSAHLSLPSVVKHLKTISFKLQQGPHLNHALSVAIILCTLCNEVLGEGRAKWAP